MPKDQVWKIISVFHTNKTKKMFSRLKNDQTFFHTFQDSVGTLHINIWQVQDDLKTHTACTYSEELSMVSDKINFLAHTQ